MTNSLIPTSSILEIDDEPRIRDVDLAERLGFVRRADIRELIVRNRLELETYGSFPCRTENPGNQGGRPGKVYYLNEGQALVICSLARTEKAAQVRKLVIDVFIAWRRGKTVDVKEHYRRPPAPTVDDGHFHIKQSAPGKLVRVDALVPFDLAAEYAMLFSNYRRVTF